MASLEAVVRRLFTISSMIAKSTTRDKFARAEVNCRLQIYESYDIAHVREKLKKRVSGDDETEEEVRFSPGAGDPAHLWLADRLDAARIDWALPPDAALPPETAGFRIPSALVGG